MRFMAKRLLGGMLCALLAAAALPALAGGVDDFKLAKAIPADVAVATCGRDHAGMKFLKEQQKRIWEEVEKQRFDRDFKKILMAAAESEGGNPDDIEKGWQQFSDLMATVDWASLCDGGESAFAMKMASTEIGIPTFDCVILTQPEAGKAQSAYDGLAGMMKALCDMAGDEIKLSKEGEGDTAIQKATFVRAPFPLAITLARHKDTLLIGFGAALPEQSLALLQKGEGKSLLSSERFQAAVKKLPAPTDSVVFIDVSKMLSSVRGIMDGALKAAGEVGDPKAQALPGKIVDAIDLWDYVVAVATTDGMKTTTTSATVLKDSAKSKPLYPVFYGNAPIADPLKFVPKNAKNFSANSGIDLLALYKNALTFIKNDAPEGEAAIAHWEAMKQTLPVDVEKDVLEWIGGSMVSFTIPGAGAFAPGDWAMLISVKNEAKAKEQITKWLDMAGELLQAQNGAINDAKIEGADGFKVVVHPMLAFVPMLSQPTVGVKDGYLFIGSAPKAISAALNAAATGDNFGKNERFVKEGQPIGKNVISYSFADQTKFGEELGQAFKTYPGMVTMFNPELGRNKAVSAAVSMLTKVGKVLTKLDFLLSQCEQSTIDGNTITTVTINHYQEPPKKTEPGASENAPEKVGG